MSALNYQKDLIANFKREVLSNTSILSKVHPIDPDLSRQIFKEDALEKPTQHIFIHLSYYLVCIVDVQRSKLITWPLYDSRAEKNYRNELSRFVADYNQLGLLAPVMSSYFVNPGCFRVVKLLFQLSHLAVQRTLTRRLKKESRIALYEDVTKKFESKNEDFVPLIETETAKLLNSFSQFIKKKRMIKNTIISLFHQKIVENEKKLASLNNKIILDDLIDNFIKSTELNDKNLKIMLDIKEDKDAEPIFNQWLEQIDCIITEMDKNWDKKFTKVVQLAENCRNTSKTLIARQTGDADRKQYSIEYNHKTDEIQTSALEAAVSMQQKFIIKNLVIKEKLQFPTLIRAYLISISHLLNGVDLTDDLDGFNFAMECEGKNYNEVLSALQALIDRIEYAEGRLLPRQLPCFNSSINIKEFTDIPPLPDLSDLKTTRDPPYQSAFTPLTLSKHQFNLRKRYANSKPIFVAPQPRLFVTPAHAPREDFLKTIQSCKMGALDKTNRTQNISLMSETAKRVNETIADCNTGFTKQQIQRLLSTKKGSTTKKTKFSTERPKINIKKGGLFNDTADSIVVRSYSSPDLYGNKRNNRQVLSVMVEDIPALFEVSGISVIRSSNEFNTSNVLSQNSSSTHFDVPNLPQIIISPVQYIDNDCVNNHVMATDLDDAIVRTTPPEVELRSKKVNPSKIPILEHKHVAEDIKTPHTEKPSRKSMSIEKIINRFKKVKASVFNDTNNDISNCSIIREEKENNKNTVNINLFHTKKFVLPDLLSPNCSNDRKSELKVDQNSFEGLCVGFEEKWSREPRQSLGTALGVDQSFLDQFELID